MNANVATSTGYTSMYINAGKISNKGVELQVSGDIIKNPKGFNWTATLNWAKDKSRIDELYTDPVTGQSLDAYQIGSSWSVKNYAMVGKSWGTLVGTGYVYNEDGSILVEDGIPVYEAGKEIGDVTPKWLVSAMSSLIRIGASVSYWISVWVVTYILLHKHSVLRRVS